MAAGRWFNHEDTQRRERVVVLGSQTAFELFSAIPPVGEEITLTGSIGSHAFIHAFGFMATRRNRGGGRGTTRNGPTRGTV